MIRTYITKKKRAGAPSTIVNAEMCKDRVFIFMLNAIVNVSTEKFFQYYQMNKISIN